MIFRESENVELKEVVVDDIRKEIIAFANGEGGKIYIGIQDDGTVIGVEDPDGSSLRISNMVRDTIKPDLTMFIHYETIVTNGKQIVVVDIQRGTERPYYIAKKGLRPEGVYVRQGYSSVPATDSAIRRMIIETDGDSFEEMRSLEQNLSFNAATIEFERRNTKFEAQQMQTLKIIDANGIYTNLGLLLSDQCSHTIKVAFFQGVDQNVFKDRHEFTGSLMQQLNDVYDYIDMHNQTKASFEKLLRIDIRDYPEVAVREALLNLLVHRDYAYSASALISIYSDRIEFISIGGLLPGIEMNDIMLGVSVCRNQKLANVFYRLQLIEAYGTGIRKIMKAYENSENKPIFESASNSFKIVLPNINSNSLPLNADIGKSLRLSEIENKVIIYVNANASITRIEVEKLLDISSSTANRLLKQMTEKNLLKKSGQGVSTKYVLPD